MIPQSFIEEVQQRTDIVEVVSSYIPLKRAGRNFKAVCPFHGEKTPSFLVSPQKQIFHCFGCGEGGGAIQFIMLCDKVNFVEAIEILAKRLAMPIPYQKSSPQEKLKTSLYDAVHEASLFFHKVLTAEKIGERALNYLEERGIKRDAIDQYRIGFALGKNTLFQYMRNKGFSLDVLEKSSLIISRDDGGYMDLFRERIIFPIFDVRGRALGFGARSLVDNPNYPKYINSPENLLYKKRDQFFGLNFSKEEITKQDSVIVCEGYLDMISPYSVGIKNIVASLGTALTFEQIKLISRYTKNITLVFDSDKAGQRATLRALDLLLENNINVKILNLPTGFDPDSIIQKNGKKYFISLLNETVDFFDYKINILKSIYDIDSINGKTKIAHDILATINKLGSEIQKHEYIKKLSSAIRVKEEVILAEFGKIKPDRALPKKIEQNNRMPIPLAEKMIFKFMLTNAKVLSAVKKRLNENDFVHPLSKRTYSVILNDFGLDQEISLMSYLSSISDKEISGFVSQVLLEDVGSLNKDILKDCILRLRSKRMRIIKEDLREKIKKAEKDSDFNLLKELLNKYKKISSEVKNG